LQAFLWFICAFHVIVGLGLNISPAFPQVMAGYYGAQVNWTPELLYLVKPIGAFMLALGVMAGAAARNPLGHRSIVYGFVVLFTLRGLQRLIAQDEIATALSIESGRNIGNAVFFLLMAAVLFWLFRAASKSAGSAA
ncbi:MAG: hypothetical protein KJO01_11215, partial [Gammaproteobacteria bacterium]|nr:hypothetical protein [Gammaproteobacteria bacterium]